ncbi:MAG: 30S ribosomal protein S6 [Patescibacteria group bacterium]|jgi:small subunit ribosomal protein S6
MTNHYELLYLVGANYTDEELMPIKEKVKELLKKFGGEITLEDSLGKKKLAYPIKGNHQGYYLLMEFNIDGAKLKELNQNLKLTSEVLRHVVVSRKIETPSLLKTTAAKLKTAEQKEREVKITPEEERKTEPEKGKIKLEDLDQRLDEILEGDIM